MKALVVSAPFGSWCQPPNCTPTLGTFTARNRGGLLYRLWRVLRTCRYSRHHGGWVNRLGLPNPGIGSLLPARSHHPHPDYRDKIISIHGFNQADEWTYLAKTLVSDLPFTRYIELNLSCPNTGQDHPRNVTGSVQLAVEILLREKKIVIAKLPPIRPMDLAADLHRMGVRWFHACNTIPVPAGGLSGKALKPFSLWAVSTMKQWWGKDVTVIGGGGVTSLADVAEHRAAGADHVAVGSWLMNPLNWRRLARWGEPWEATA